jgi:hypothetical protein
MSPLRARVEKGRLVLDEPTTLPEGTVLDLVADDEGDDLSETERRALHDALSASWQSAEAGSAASGLSDGLTCGELVVHFQRLLHRRRAKP